MKLHENKQLFQQAITATSQAKSNLSEVLVEKDYWVCYTLKKLALSNHVDYAIFKGGTSLSKAYKLIDRFSEDIDLAVIAKGMSGNKVKTLIKKIEQDITATDYLTEVEIDGITSKKSKFRKTIHEYPKMVKGAKFGQASDKLLLEINSFTNPYPYELRSITTYIADFLAGTEQLDFIKEYELEPVEVNVLSLKRTFTEKLMGLVRVSYDENPVSELSRRIRHVYDLHMLVGESDVRKFMEDKVQLKEMIEHVKNDDRENHEFDGDWLDVPLLESPLLRDNTLLKKLASTYNGNDFKGLVFGDLPPFESVLVSINDIKQNLYSI